MKFTSAQISAAMAQIGAKGGSAKSARKTAANLRNARLPRKKARNK